jgi:acetyl-CoA carboxylase carboxyltransferase component
MCVYCACGHYVLPLCYRKYENEGIAKHGAKMVMAVACAQVLVHLLHRQYYHACDAALCPYDDERMS